MRDSLLIDRLIPGEMWLDRNRDDPDYDEDLDTWLQLKRCYEETVDLLDVWPEAREQFRERAMMVLFEGELVENYYVN